jgi:hypothetical protein
MDYYWICKSPHKYYYLQELESYYCYKNLKKICRAVEERDEVIYQLRKEKQLLKQIESQKIPDPPKFDEMEQKLTPTISLQFQNGTEVKLFYDIKQGMLLTVFEFDVWIIRTNVDQIEYAIAEMSFDDQLKSVYQKLREVNENSSPKDVMFLANQLSRLKALDRKNPTRIFGILHKSETIKHDDRLEIMF